MQCLVLNASYEPLPPVNTPRAVRLILQGKAEVVEIGDRLLRSGTTSIPQPVVIRLRKFVRVPYRMRRHVNNILLFARDRHQCAYCGRKERDLGPRESLTRDHVLPLSRGGENTWENVVAACSSCNRRKSNQTPDEARMPLRVTPNAPQLVMLEWKLRKLTPLQEQYLQAFYGPRWADSVLGAARA